MKKFYYAVLDEQKNAHVLTVYEGENLATKIKDLHLIVVHPCEKFAQAITIREAWRAAK